MTVKRMEAKWFSTKMCIGSATSAARKDCSSASPRSSSLVTVHRRSRANAAPPPE